MSYVLHTVRQGSYTGGMKKLSDVVRDARRALGMTQSELETAIDKRYGYVGMLETDKIGRPKPDTLRRLSAALKVPLEDLVRATNQLDAAPQEDAAAAIQRIAALPLRSQRLAAWSELPPPMRAAILILMRDVFETAADQLEE